MAQLKAFCVVDAAGPFQGGSLNFAKAAIEAGCHYVDLADARDFVSKFTQLHDLAGARGVVAVSGASSTPALSIAVIDDITSGWTRIDEVQTSILPSGRAQMGLSVVRAILSYAGRPVRLWRHGRWDLVPGWALLARRDVEGLGRRFLSLVETPDLDLVPAKFTAVRSVTFLANVELAVMHLGLWFLSLFVRLKLVRSLVPFARPLHWVAQILAPFGSDRGGMCVDVTGVNADGQLVRSNWSLIADAGHGPHIPSLPALCVIRGLLDGSLSKQGAFACAGIVKLDKLEEQFKRFSIRTMRHVILLEALPLFRRAHEKFVLMPQCVREAHAPDPASELEGEVEIEAGANAFARLAAWFAGFPTRSQRCSAEVTIERAGNDELWIRRFGSHVFQSILSMGTGPNHIRERFGSITIDLELVADRKGFSLTVRGWSVLGIPLPRLLAPTTHASASSDSDGRYRFDTLITWPLAGRLVRYHGWLTPVIPLAR